MSVGYSIHFSVGTSKDPGTVTSPPWWFIILWHGEFFKCEMLERYMKCFNISHYGIVQGNTHEMYETVMFLQPPLGGSLYSSMLTKLVCTISCVVSLYFSVATKLACTISYVMSL